MSRKFFKQWVQEDGQSNHTLLPLTHITRSVHARGILIDGFVEARYCDVQKANLVYCFYGRAAYRLSEENAITLEDLTPLCMVFKGSLLHDAEDVFPFDTGAFENSLFKDFIGKNYHRDDFSIKGDHRLPNTLIEKIYPDVLAYSKSSDQHIVYPDDVADRGEFEAQAYLHMLNSKSKNGPDNRLSSIEVTFSKDVNLLDNLECIIAPNTLIHGSAFQKWVKPLRHTIELYPYEFSPRNHVEFYHGLIEKNFVQFCKDKGYVSDV